MAKDLISVIVPVYNGEKFIESCVAALQAQTYPNLEIILIDDGSEDSSWPVCTRLAASDPRIRIKHMDNRGQGAARNTGMEMASGEYIGFCDVDDRMDPRMYETLHRMICENHADFAGCDHSSMENGIVTYKRGGSSKETVVADTAGVLRVFATGKGIAWGVWDKLFRASACRSIRFPREKWHGEDTLFLLDFIRGNHVFCWAELGMYYHNDTNQASCTKRAWSKSNLGLTVFYRRLAETVEEYGLAELVDSTRVRHYQNLLSAYIRCRKHRFLPEADALHREMAAKRKQMLASSLSLPMKLDFLLCVYCPRLGPVLNFAYR